MRSGTALAGFVLLAVAAGAGYRYGARAGSTPAVPTATRPAPMPQLLRSETASVPVPISEGMSLAEAVALPSDFAQTAATYALAARSGEAALRKLIDAANGMAHRGDRAAVLTILFSRYGELDPPAALAHLDATGIEPKGTLLFTLLHSWAKVDLDAAIAAAHERPGRGERQVANDAILRAHAEADGAVRRAVAARLPLTSGGTPYSPDEILNLAATDIDTAFEHALALPAGVAMQVVGTIGGNWAMRDPEAAYAYASRLREPGLRTTFIRGVLFRWGEEDPARVMRLLDESVRREEQEDVINSALVGIAMRDPHAAFRLSLALRDTAVRDAAFRQVLRTWTPEDPAAAADAIEATTDVAVRARLAEIAAPSLLRKWGSAERTLDWAAQMDDPSGRVTAATFQELTRYDPAQAFALATSASTEQQSRWLTLVLGDIAAADTERAALYFQQLPGDDRRTAVAYEIVSRWAPRDAQAAEQWVLGLPAGAAQDAALEALVLRSPGEPARAARLINGMQMTDRRAAAAFSQVRSLLRQGDRTGAERIFEGVALGPEQRSQLRRTIDEWSAEHR